MSKNERARPQGTHPKEKGRRHRPDQRIQRTHQRLGSALVQLMQEKPMDEVTVQEVLDRAAVGRSTFYLHFQGKNDLLLSQFEKFLELSSTALSVRKEASQRVVPVKEMFEHIAGQKKLYRAMADAGKLNDFFDLAEGYYARGIEQRLRELKRGNQLPAYEWRARASSLAGSLLALLRWWVDHGAKESPAAMDELFHRMVWNGLR